MVYLPKGVHLKKLRGLVGNTHLKILVQLNLHPTVLCSNKRLEGILVSWKSMQYLWNQKIKLRRCVENPLWMVISQYTCKLSNDIYTYQNQNIYIDRRNSTYT